MAGVADARAAGLEIVGPICGHKARSFSEAEIGRILHAYLLGKYAGVVPEYPVTVGKKTGAIDFRFGDRPHGSNPCVLELAVRNSEGGQQLLASQNRTEL